MPASAAIIANFSKLQRGDGGSPEVFTEGGEGFDLRPSAPTSPDIDVTSLGSTAREKRGGLPDFGTATVSMNFLQGNAQQEAMEDEAGRNIPRNYRILHPNGVNGYQAVLILKACGVTGYQVDGKLIRVATFAVS